MCRTTYTCDRTGGAVSGRRARLDLAASGLGSARRRNCRNCSPCRSCPSRWHGAPCSSPCPPRRRRRHPLLRGPESDETASFGKPAASSIFAAHTIWYSSQPSSCRAEARPPIALAAGHVGVERRGPSNALRATAGGLSPSAASRQGVAGGSLCEVTGAELGGFGRNRSGSFPSPPPTDTATAETRLPRPVGLLTGFRRGPFRPTTQRHGRRQSYEGVARAPLQAAGARGRRSEVLCAAGARVAEAAGGSLPGLGRRHGVARCPCYEHTTQGAEHGQQSASWQVVPAPRADLQRSPPRFCNGRRCRVRRPNGCARGPFSRRENGALALRAGRD